MPLTPADRKAELVRRGVKMVTIAATLGVSVSHVSLVVSGARRNARIEQAVSILIGKPVDEVFGPSPQSVAA